MRREEQAADRIEVLERVHRDAPEVARRVVAALHRHVAVGRLVERDGEQEDDDLDDDFERFLGVHGAFGRASTARARMLTRNAGRVSLAAAAGRRRGGRAARGRGRPRPSAMSRAASSRALLHPPHVADEVADAEQRDAALARPERVAGAAALEVLLGHDEAVVRLLEDRRAARATPARPSRPKSRTQREARSAAPDAARAAGGAGRGRSARRSRRACTTRSGRRRRPR